MPSALRESLLGLQASLGVDGGAGGAGQRQGGGADPLDGPPRQALGEPQVLVQFHVGVDEDDPLMQACWVWQVRDLP